MKILRVYLENVKNHEQAEFTFEQGTNAICGPNGAGKTSIIEAVSYALFDYLPYRKEDFVRRGAKQGKVGITFQSALDERIYTVIRSTTNVYFVHDEELNLRVAEQKADTIAWLLQHLGLEATVSLPDLFETSIGVPQGTFTADFKKTPSMRKTIFDKILRVEEYRQAADKLRETQRVAENRLSDLQTEIAALDGELKQLPEVLEFLKRTQQNIAQLEADIQKLEAELGDQTKALAAFDEQADKIKALATNIEKLNLQKTHHDGEKQAVAQELAKAQAAQKIVQENESAYREYLDTRKQIEALDHQRQQRDDLQKKLNQKENVLAEMRSEFRTVRDQLKQIEADKTAYDALHAKVEEQSTLEQQLTRLKIDQSSVEQLQQKKVDLEKEIARLTQRLDEAEKAVADLAQYREAAQTVPDLEKKLADVQQEEREKGTLQIHQKQWQEQQTQLTSQLQQYRQKLAETADAISEIEPLQEMAATYDSLADKQSGLQTQLAQLRAQVKKDADVLSQVKGGLCPFLNEECRNVPPDQTLEDFFKLEMADYSQQITATEAELAETTEKFERAREASVKVENMAHLQKQRNELETEISRLEENVAAVEAKLVETPLVSGDDLQALASQIKQVNTELNAARAAKNKYDTLEMTQRQQEDIARDLAERQKQMQAVIAQLEPLQGTTERITAVEAQIKALGDPRSQSLALKRQIDTEPEKQKRLADLEEEGTALRAEIADLNEAMTVFADLEAQWQAAQEASKNLEPRYQLYLTNQATAAQLQTIEERLAGIEKSLHDVAIELKRLTEEAEQIGASYDAAAHENTRQKVQDLRDQKSVKNENLRINLQNQTESEARKAKLEALAEQRNALQHDAEKTDRLTKFVTYARTILKEAGPFVTEVYQTNISLAADLIFREITGNPFMSLRWTADYEIVVEEEGRERSFNNLSGGEQMSAALAVRLALLKEVSEVDFAFFDEPTTNMDETRRRNLAEQIRQIRGFSQLFVISHDDTFERVTDHVIHLGSDGEASLLTPVAAEV